MAAMPESRLSLRLRIRAWNAAVITLTVALLTSAEIYQGRQELLRTERAHVEALLAHLAHMPEFQRDAQTATARLALLRDSLHAAGGELELVPSREGAAAGAANPGGVLATWRLSLREGSFDLRYRTDPGRPGSLTRRSILTHLLYGFLALAALVAGTEWILRRNLVVPLRSLSHQLDRMQGGGGWLAKAPPTDEELAGLARAVADLGPGLERQASEWIEAERRSAVALTVANIRSRLREPLERALALIADLRAREDVAGDGKPELLALLASLDRISRVPAAEEQPLLGRRAAPRP